MGKRPMILKSCESSFSVRKCPFLNYLSKVTRRPSQWPRGLTHEMSSPAQTLGSWVLIPFEAWIAVHISSVFVLSCVDSGLATGLITRPRSPTDCP
jgi:hypothetical protein